MIWYVSLDVSFLVNLNIVFMTTICDRNHPVIRTNTVHKFFERKTQYVFWFFYWLLQWFFLYIASLLLFDLLQNTIVLSVVTYKYCIINCYYYCLIYAVKYNHFKFIMIVLSLVFYFLQLFFRNFLSSLNDVW